MSYFDVTTLAALATGRLFVRTAVLMNFDEGAKGYWSDAGMITINGVTYSGNNAVGTIEGLQASADLSMADITLQMSAADPQVVSDFTTLSCHFRRINIYDYLFDPTMRTVYPTPLWQTPGLVERVTQPRGNAILSIRISSLLRRSVMNSAGYRSDGDQKGRLSTDTFFRDVWHAGRAMDWVWGIRHFGYGNAVVRGLPATKGP